VTLRIDEFAIAFQSVQCSYGLIHSDFLLIPVS